ncbi:recombinase family protein [Thiorhodococcus fuscus]|uniref:Recombinase family protein n=1 Tax=Thiorhodococcus fuscus TaxID=527200 RepID=A0ABW4Y4Y9_9GAMM
MPTKTASGSPKAFSYLRFSTPEQERGDSFRRQTSLAQAWCIRRGIDLDESSYQDLGVSAYRGANAETGKLGEFMDAVKEGLIPRGSYLLIESLDRLSRMTPRRALRVLTDICDEGIVVVTLSDNREYTSETLDADPLSFMVAFLVTMRANEESAAKARRIKAVWDNKRKQALEQGKALTSVTPGWLQLVDGQYRLIPERAAVVKQIFAWLAEGRGLDQIVRMLNTQEIPTFGKSEYWSKGYIAKLRDNPAVVGTLIPHVTSYDKGKRIRTPQDPVPGYFPAAVDQDTFNTVAARAATRQPKVNHGRSVSFLLASLAKCPVCGSSMTRTQKGKGMGPGDSRLVCTKGKAGAGCSYRSVVVQRTEDALRQHASFIVGTAPSGDALVDSELTDVEVKLTGIEEVMGHIMEAIEHGGGRESGSMPLLSSRLAALEEERRALEQTRRELMEKLSTMDSTMVDKRLARLEDVLLSGDIHAGNTLLRELFTSVVVDYERGELRLQWIHGGETCIPYAMPLKSA